MICCCGVEEYIQIVNQTVKTDLYRKRKEFMQRLPVDYALRRFQDAETQLHAKNQYVQPSFLAAFLASVFCSSHQVTHPSDRQAPPTIFALLLVILYKPGVRVC